MAGVSKIAITESEEQLKKLLSTEKDGNKKEKIQVLFLLKTKQAKTITVVAQMIGRNRSTVQEWLRKYRDSGLTNLLTKKIIPGRKSTIPDSVQQLLKEKLQQEEFNSYGEICTWLKNELGIEAKYKTVHKLVYYQLKAKLKPVK